MKEFVEKLIGRLEDARRECQKLQKTTTDAYGYMKQKQGIDVAKEIVNQLAEEYKPQLNDNDLMIVESLPSLYPIKDFEEEALQRVIGCAEKYNNCWIACSERLPENPCWTITCDEEENIHMFFYIDGYFHETYGKKPITEKHERFCVPVAWQHLPKPYKKGE